MSLDAIFSLVVCATFLGIYVLWLLSRRILGPDFKLWKFQSQVAAACFFMVLLSVAAFTLAWLLFKLGGCQGGMERPIECTRLPNSIGESAHFTFLVIAASSPAVLLACLIVGIVYERRVRRS